MDKLFKLIFTFLGLLQFNCGVPWCPCTFIYPPRMLEGGFVHYDTDFNQMTPLGIRIDDDTSTVDFDKIDTVVTRISECVLDLVKTGYIPSEKAGCLLEPLRMRQDPDIHSCLKLKIVEPILSVCSEWHFLDFEAPQYLCDAKNLKTNSDCPCRWRWIVQNYYEIVSPPGHFGVPYLYDVVKLMTTCNNPWSDIELTRCMMLAEY